jgi:hypothetical protein
MEQDIDHNNLGDLFKKQVLNYQPEVSEEEWNSLEVKLKKINFLRFSLTNFNIYYCFMILSCFIFNSAIFVDYFLLHRENPQVTSISVTPSTQSKSKIEDKSLLKTGNNFINLPDRKKADPAGNTILHDSIINYPNNDFAEKNIVHQDSGKINSEKNVNINFSSYGNNRNNNVDSAAQRKVNLKKTLYITRQDTIVVYDTLSNKKRRIKKIK